MCIEPPAPPPEDGCACPAERPITVPADENNPNERCCAESWQDGGDCSTKSLYNHDGNSGYACCFCPASHPLYTPGEVTQCCNGGGECIEWTGSMCTP
jgi:hypothetical protein